MDELMFRELYAVLDEVVSADPGWLAEVYTPMACLVCHDLLPEHWDFPIDVHLDPQVSRLRAPTVGLLRGNLCVVRSDILELVEPHLEFFSVGRVLRGGVELDDYACLLADRPARVPTHGTEGSVESDCPRCGRRFERLVPPRYVKLADTHGKHALADCTGRVLRVSEELFSDLPGKTRSEFRSRGMHIAAR